MTSRSRSTTLLSALLLLCFALPSSGQTIDRERETNLIGGRFFYVTLPDTVGNAQDARFTSARLGDQETYVLLIYSAVEQTVRLDHPSLPDGVEIAVGADEIVEYDLEDFVIAATTTINTPSTDAIMVRTSAEPIVLYVAMSNRFGTAAFTPLPIDSWGREYVAASWPGTWVRNVYTQDHISYLTEKRPAPAMLTIVAAYDDTEVEIIPSDSLQFCRRCRTVTLDEGETYMVQSYVDTSLADDHPDLSDIAGTRIIASQPVGVISGNTRTQIHPFGFPTLAGNSPKDLAVEWLRPTELHGSEFVWTSLKDELRHRGVDAERERKNEVVRIYPSTVERTSAGYSRERDSVLLEDGALKTIGARFEQVIALDTVGKGRHFTTSHPSQAFFSPQSHIYFRGTTGWGNFIGSAYDSWGTSLVELVPRSQWSSFAPFRVPSFPRTLHYLTVVTDSGSATNITYRQTGSNRSTAFPFQHSIPGTDYVWGSVTLSDGVGYLVEGEEGARFSGYVYGTNDGYELFRPGGTERDDEKDRASSRRHPGEYEELIAEAYAFPLPSAHYRSRAPNEFEIEVVEDSCGGALVTIDIIGENPTLRFLRLASDSTVNTRIEWIEPAQLLPGVPFPSRIVFRLVPIRTNEAARALVEWRDRTRDGKVEHLTVVLDPTVIDRSVDAVRFDERDWRSDTSIVFVNRSGRPVLFRSAMLLDPAPELSIVGTIPATPWSDSSQVTTIEPGDSIEVLLEASAIPDDESISTLRLDFDCGVSLNTSIRISPDLRCLRVSDLDFGLLEPGQSKTLDLEICNLGEQGVSFADSSASGGGAFLSWLDRHFEVESRAITMLERTTLGSGECLSISVTFRAETVGDFSTVARFWANTRRCRDTSIWRARVRDSVTVSVDRELPTPDSLDLSVIDPIFPRKLPLLPDTDRRKRPEGHFVYLAPWLWTSSSTYRSSSARSLRSGRERN